MIEMNTNKSGVLMKLSTIYYIVYSQLTDKLAIGNTYNICEERKKFISKIQTNLFDLLWTLVDHAVHLLDFGSLFPGFSTLYKQILPYNEE
jgi:hypothetical protein